MPPLASPLPSASSGPLQVYASPPRAEACLSPLEAYLCAQIPAILRPAKGFLKHPFIVPGGIFHDEQWDWDSFWVTKAVLGFRDRLDASLVRAFLGHAVGSWKNFFEHQSPLGAVPIMAKSDNPDFFDCAGRGGIEKNQAKPVFGQYALDICRATGDFAWVGPYFERLLRFYDRWFSHYGSGSGLLVWGSDVAIGVDNDPTAYGRPEFSSGNLLLNCLFYSDLMASSELAQALRRPADAAGLRAKAASLAQAIQTECWDPADGFFYSVDVHCADHRGRYLPGLRKGMALSWKTLPLKVKMFTGFLPLWCGLATDAQARSLVQRYLRNDAEFRSQWGLRSLARSERMYDPATDSANPSNWLGPVWIVANYMVYEGLRRYGYPDDARWLAERMHALLGQDLARTGTQHECYNADTGAPNFNGHFLSWNLLTLLMR